MPITTAEVKSLTVADITKAVGSYDAGDRIWNCELSKVATYIVLHEKKYPALFIASTAVALKYPIKYKNGMHSRDSAGCSNHMIAHLKKLAFIIEIDPTKKRKSRKVRVKVKPIKSIIVKEPTTLNGTILPTDRISEIFNDVNHQVVVTTPTKQEPSKSSLDPHLVEAYKQLLRDGWRPS